MCILESILFKYIFYKIIPYFKSQFNCLNTLPSSNKLFIHALHSALPNSHPATFPVCCTKQLNHTKHRHVRTTSAKKSNQTRLAWRGPWHARPMINDWQINMESKGGKRGMRRRNMANMKLITPVRNLHRYIIISIIISFISNTPRIFINQFGGGVHSGTMDMKNMSARVDGK